MSSAFDPYREWLGIPKQGFHPDRYRLLGLEPFEEDPATIAAAAAAAAAQVNRVKPHLAGSQAAAAQKLLQELELARACLLDSAKKPTYDNMLRQQMATRPAQSAGAESPQRSAPIEPRQALPAVTPDGAIDDLLPPEVGLPPQAVPDHASPMPPRAYPHAMPKAPMPGVAQPIAGEYAQVVAVSAMPAYPTAVPMPTAYPAQPRAVPMAQQAIPVQSYGGMAGVAMPVAGYGMQQASSAVAMAVPMASDQAMSMAAPVAEAMDSFAPTRSRPSMALRKARNRRTISVLLAVAIPLGLVLAMGLGAWFLKKRGLLGGPSEEQVAVFTTQDPHPQPVRPAHRSSPTNDVVPPTEPSERPADPDMASASMDPPSEMPDPSTTPAPTPEPTPESTPTPMPEPASMPATAEPAPMMDPVEALAAARYALTTPDLKAAKKYLDAAAAAASEEQAQEVARVTAMHGYVEMFWNAVSDGLKQLMPGAEFKYNDEPAVVVDNADGVLTVRMAGQNREFKLDKLPAKLAVAIAEYSFKNDDPAAKVSIGAFLAVAPKGDKELARGLWLQAGLLGLQDEVDVVMPELEVKYPDKPVAVSLPSAAPPADGRGARPTAEAQKTALEAIHQLYADDYSAAKAPPDKAVLADKLLTQAIDTSDDATKRYVLLVEARNLGVEAGDPSLVTRAIDALAGMYAVDAMAMKAEMLAAVGKTASGAEANAALARTALDLADEAVLAEQFAAAKSLVRTALAAARKSKDGDLIKEASQRNDDVRKL